VRLGAFRAVRHRELEERREELLERNRSYIAELEAADPALELPDPKPLQTEGIERFHAQATFACAPLDAARVGTSRDDASRSSLSVPSCPALV